MKDLLVTDAELSPAKVWWNHLSFDVSLPLSAQLDDLHDDLLFAEFSNGCRISVGWLPEGREPGEFHVHLNQNPDYWEPTVVRTCVAFTALRHATLEVVGLARAETNRYLLSKSIVGADEVTLNRLTLDLSKPPETQLGDLPADLFEAAFSARQFILTVHWQPGHDAGGEFVACLFRRGTEYSNSSRDVSQQVNLRSSPPILERRSGSMDGMLKAVRELVGVAKADSPMKRSTEPQC